jgi:hypothetical protein
MSNVVQEKRRLMEEKAKILQEKARLDKLTIDKKLTTEILEEENRTHDENIKELEKKIEEEKNTHNGAVRDLENKIADLEQQIKASPSTESPVPQADSKRALETPENTEDGVSTIVIGGVETVLPPAPENADNQIHEGPKKKKRNIF